MNKKTILAIVVPCYNEEEILNDSISILLDKLTDLIKEKKIDENSYLLFIDDGSSDNTWNIIKDHTKNNSRIKGIKLSKNQGHQYALLSGINYVQGKCDCLISLDADLQDDIETINAMIQRYNDGYEIVYGVRSNRETDTFFKKFTAETYYKFMNFIGVKLVFNHADYRLMSNKAIKFFNDFNEINLFIRGIIPLIGLKSSTVYYKRKERMGGVTKYPLRKMLSFGFNGITSFSTAPLRFISIVGFIIFIFSFLMGLYIFYVSLFTNNTIPGWTSTVLPIYFIGGIQLLSVGVVGEYIGKIYTETKKRPKYFIEEILNGE